MESHKIRQKIHKNSTTNRHNAAHQNINHNTSQYAQHKRHTQHTQHHNQHAQEHHNTHAQHHTSTQKHPSKHISYKVIVIKSHLFNALAPKFFKHLFWNAIFFTFLYSIYYFINKYFNVGFETELILALIFLTLIFSFFKILKDLIIILNTTFSFHHSYLERKFKFFTEKTHTVSYTQITDIQIIKSIWDRICGVGDIHIHTAADEYAGKADSALILRDVKDPEKIKHAVVKKIHED